MVSSATKNETAPGGQPPERSATRPSSTIGVWLRAGLWVRSESLLLAVLAGSFLARFLVADRNSYWLDELYSVAIYGIWNDTAMDAVRYLAETSIHPPLYQFTLFHWMTWFGDTELATRSLSNLYITLATLFLYLAMRDVFSRRVGIASAVAFTLMYTPMYYGLETRSYAQTMFLVTLSSYLLLRIMHKGAEQGWRLAVVSPTGSLFVATNTALLLTHYYNAFFWVAQGIAAAVFVLREHSPRKWLAAAGVLVGLYGLQAAIFLGVWGRVLIGQIGRRAGDFAVEGPQDLHSPFRLLHGSVLSPNLDLPTWIARAGLTIAAVLAAKALIHLGRRRRGLTFERRRAWAVVYLFLWLVLPLVIVYITFSTAGVARYSDRYFLYSVVPLAPLFVLTIDEGVRLASLGLRRLKKPDWHAGWSVVLTIIATIALVVPTTYAAATRTKSDWRGSAQDIVSIVESNPDSNYLIYETSFRSTPVLDYYLGRYSDDVRVGGTIRRSEERRGTDFAFEQNTDAISEYDFLIVPFIHHRTTAFPVALERLREAYHVQHWQIDRENKGLVVFATASTE